MFRLLIPIGILLVIDLYFFQLIKTMVTDIDQRWRTVWYMIYWSLTAMTLGVVIAGIYVNNLPNYFKYYFFSFLLVVLVPKLIGILFLLGEDAYRFMAGAFSMTKESDGPFLADRRKFISQAGLIAASIPFATMLYGMVRTAFNFQVKESRLLFDDLPPKFDGLRIVQFSDLHSGSFTSTDFFSSAVDRILELEPDLIFFTGDLVNNSSSEAEPFLAEFKRLKARLGVFSILGNHDYGDYGPWPSKEAKAANLARLKQIHSESGWNVLLNSNQIIEKAGEQIAIVGVENWGASRHFPKYGDLDKAVVGTENVPFKILLSHDPSHWDAQVKNHAQKFQLTLSGHTHGFQFGIDIPGFKWSPVQYVYKQWSGLYEELGQKLYVNQGLGFIGYMGRVGISPEITLLELKSTKIS
jgi:hypothetical protein